MVDQVVGVVRAEQVGAAEPYSSEPPENTATGSPCSSRAWARWVKVCPGVASARTVIESPTAMTSPSRTGTRSNATGSSALTWYAAPVRAARAYPPVT